MAKPTKTKSSKWRNPVVSAVTDAEVLANLDKAAAVNKRRGRKEFNTRSKVAGKVLELGWPTFLHLYPLEGESDQAA